MIKELYDEKLHEYLSEKDELVKKGRKLSAKVEITQRKIEANEKKQRTHTAYKPQELWDKAVALDAKIAKDLTELEGIQKEVMKIKAERIPATVAKEFEYLKKEKEDYEIERNKVALKVQKIKDRAVPLIQKLMKPFLGEYEDIDTAELKGEKIIVKTFSHLENWKENFAKKAK